MTSSERSRKRLRKAVVADSCNLRNSVHDFEQKTTMFRGRLGYACLNTVLRRKKPAKEAVFCSRTCRLDSLKKNGIEWVKDLGRKNVEDLIKIIQWNEANHIRFFRISSDIFPFASHATHGYSLEYCAPLLQHAGAVANQYGHRLTMHPGQFTQLGSPKSDVLQSSIRELIYHCEVLERMGVGADGVIIVHGGGLYGNKDATLSRIKQTVLDLPSNVRNRLVLENDELCYTAEDLLPLCEELKIPLVFDYHHDILNPSSIPPRAIIERTNAVFSYRGIRPKQHLSEPRPGAVTLAEKRAHANRCQNLPPDLPVDMGQTNKTFTLEKFTLYQTDLMIEAKDKEQAVFQLYLIYGLRPVNPAVYDSHSTKVQGKQMNEKRTRVSKAKKNGR